MSRSDQPGVITFPAVTFPAGASTVDHTITTEDDDEALGTYDLIIGVAQPANDVGQPNTNFSSLDESTVTVRDGEQPGVWIETVDGDGSAGNGNPYPSIQIPRSITEGEEMFFILKRKYRGPQLTINVEGMGAETFVEGEAQEITLNRNGDATHFMSFDTRVETTVHHPDPSKESTSTYTHPFSYLLQGESSRTRRIRGAPRVDALGASGSIRLLPYECIDSPGFSNHGGCSLTLQYLLGSQIEQTFTIYSDLMGVRIEADQTRPPWERAAPSPSPWNATEASPASWPIPCTSPSW